MAATRESLSVARAGIYGAVTRIGRLAVGQTIILMRRAEQSRNALIDYLSTALPRLRTGQRHRIIDPHLFDSHQHDHEE